MVVVALHDHTEQRAVHEHLDQTARHDPLTGLINRGEILRRLAAIDPFRGGPKVAAVFLDLDGFKLVNDARGGLGWAGMSSSSSAHGSPRPPTPGRSPNGSGPRSTNPSLWATAPTGSA